MVPRAFGSHAGAPSPVSAGTKYTPSFEESDRASASVSPRRRPTLEAMTSGRLDSAIQPASRSMDAGSGCGGAGGVRGASAPSATIGADTGADRGSRGSDR